MFSQDRHQLRLAYYEAWRKQCEGLPLTALESIIAQVVQEHPEYHRLLTSEDELHQDFLPENGQTNPFLHMSLHLGIREQVGTDRPAGITQIHHQLTRRYGDVHRAEHAMMDCLAEALWQAQRQQREPDEQAYLSCLQSLVQKKGG